MNVRSRSGAVRSSFVSALLTPVRHSKRYDPRCDRPNACFVREMSSVPPELAIPADELKNVRVASTLAKRSSSFPFGWSSRYCVLSGNHLYVYKVALDAAPKKVLCIDECTVTVRRRWRPWLRTAQPGGAMGSGCGECGCAASEAVAAARAIELGPWGNASAGVPARREAA